MVARASVWFAETILHGGKGPSECPATGTILRDCKGSNEYEVCLETTLRGCKGLCEGQAAETVLRFEMSHASVRLLGLCGCKGGLYIIFYFIYIFF